MLLFSSCWRPCYCHHTIAPDFVPPHFVSCLAVAGDQTNNCCMICNCNDDVWEMNCHAFRGEEGVEEGAEHTILWSFCAHVSCGGRMPPYPDSLRAICHEILYPITERCVKSKVLVLRSSCWEWSCWMLYYNWKTAWHEKPSWHGHPCFLSGSGHCGILCVVVSSADLFPRSVCKLILI